MRIAFDHQAFCLQRTGGVSRYFCELASAMLSTNLDLKIFAPLYRNTYLRDLPSANVQGYWIKEYPPYTAALCTSIMGRVASAAIDRWQPDLVHETYYSDRPSGSKKVVTVLTVFDMISELGLMSDQASLTDIKRSPKYRAVQRADHIICISQSTQRDLIRLFDVPASKTTVIYLGCDAFRVKPYEALASVNAPDAMLETSVGAMTSAAKHAKPYLLYVGLRGAYKNFSRLLKAYAHSKRLTENFDLIAFGAGAFTKDEKTLITELGLTCPQVQQITGTDEYLAMLYRQAAAFVYPSCYEGFGLPPLEAMAQGCPVVSSHTSSMPEVIGDAAEYFDPDDVDDMSAAIGRVVYSSERRKELTQKGYVRSKMFDWTTCASETTRLYQTIAARSR
jgi:glycosyltransferase involved in cell wall biosynthesis